MKYTVTYISYYDYEVEADTLEEALEKAETCCDADDRIEYAERLCAWWEDGDGNYNEEYYK